MDSAHCSVNVSFSFSSALCAHRSFPFTFAGLFPNSAHSSESTPLPPAHLFGLWNWSRLYFFHLFVTAFSNWVIFKAFKHCFPTLEVFKLNSQESQLGTHIQVLMFRPEPICYPCLFYAWQPGNMLSDFLRFKMALLFFTNSVQRAVSQS